MNVLIIGYGRVGREVMRLLLAGPHRLRLIEREREVLEADWPRLRELAVVGDALDMDVLREAAIEQAEVVLALTPEENTNLAIAQLARRIFQVPRVIALAYDPGRREDFQQAGAEVLLLTVAGAEFLVQTLASPSASGVPSAATWEGALLRPVEPPPPPVSSAARGRGYVVIAGGGKVGYHLAKSLLREGHEAAVIERRPEVYRRLRQQIEVPVLLGDASLPQVLEQAGCGRADVFVAVTNRDHDNLIACQVARSHFNVPRTMARAKDPKFEAIFTALGVDIVVSSTAMITQAITNALPFSQLKRIMEMPRGQLRLGEFVVQPGSLAVGRAIRTLNLPDGANLVALIRAGEVILPRGETVLGQLDELVALYRVELESRLRGLFFMPATEPDNVSPSGTAS